MYLCIVFLNINIDQNRLEEIFFVTCMLHALFVEGSLDSTPTENAHL